jgi:hypothetical protein
MISTRFGINDGPASKQSFKDSPLGPLKEAAKTGLTFVVRLLSFTTGLWDK